ncbi:hypothetical protein AAG570_000886 [Ranatra chinensis]|uniref:Uncharacterized protein n=1 Tax=Ranatra chinensis TaxID=642074 RepID=A0ABD0YYE4_9HEMI
MTSNGDKCKNKDAKANNVPGPNCHTHCASSNKECNNCSPWQRYLLYTVPLLLFIPFAFWKSRCPKCPPPPPCCPPPCCPRPPPCCPQKPQTPCCPNKPPPPC